MSEKIGYKPARTGDKLQTRAAALGLTLVCLGYAKFSSGHTNSISTWQISGPNVPLKEFCGSAAAATFMDGYEAGLKGTKS